MKKMNVFRRAITALTTAIVAVTANSFTFTTRAVEETPDFKEMTDKVIYLVNEARAEAGLDPIYAVPYLSELATERAEECVVSFSHTRTNGDNFDYIIDYDKAPWIWAGENIASGMNTPEATFEQWRNSPSHWAAIMDPVYTHMGVGVTYDPNSKYGWYWDQLFISIDTLEAPDGKMDGQYYPDEYQIIPCATGDIDGDGVVDSFDFVMLCRYLNGQTTLNPRQLESAEIFKDGAVTYADALYLRKYILGAIDTIPVKLF
ncbi:MAG: SCP-like extracellular [Ruminococcus sp.]|nr:SCP-like extracellular [Ruminococcus sp.]MDE6539434.1 SCP-like extracellular [Ruminococcus sp.]